MYRHALSQLTAATQLTCLLWSVLPTQIHVTVPHTGNTLVHDKTKMRGASLLRPGYSLRFRCNVTEPKGKCLQPGGYG